MRLKKEVAYCARDAMRHPKVAFRFFSSPASRCAARQEKRSNPADEEGVIEMLRGFPHTEMRV